MPSETCRVGEDASTSVVTGDQWDADGVAVGGLNEA